MIFKILTLFAIANLSGAFEITWSRYKEAKSITVNETSYSVTDNVHLKRGGLTSIAILGRYATDFGRWHTITFDTLGRNWYKGYAERIKESYLRSIGDDSCGPGLTLIEPERYVFDGNVLKSSHGGRENFVTYETNGYYVFMLDENKYSVSGPSLPEEMERFFVDDDMIAIVEKDGRTSLRPSGFLQERPDLEDLYCGIEISIKPVESSRRLLVNFDDRLAKMEKNLTSKVNEEIRIFLDNYDSDTNGLKIKMDELLD